MEELAPQTDLTSLETAVVLAQRAHDARFAELLQKVIGERDIDPDTVSLDHALAMLDPEYAELYTALSEAKRLNYEAQVREHAKGSR